MSCGRTKCSSGPRGLIRTRPISTTALSSRRSVLDSRLKAKVHQRAPHVGKREDVFIAHYDLFKDFVGPAVAFVGVL